MSIRSDASGAGRPAFRRPARLGRRLCDRRREGSTSDERGTIEKHRCSPQAVPRLCEPVQRVAGCLRHTGVTSVSVRDECVVGRLSIHLR